MIPQAGISFSRTECQRPAGAGRSHVPPSAVSHRATFKLLACVLLAPLLVASPLSSLATGQEEPPLQQWIAQLKDSDVERRRDAAYALSAMGRDAVAAAPALIAALSDRDPQVWAAAARGIARIGPAAADAIPALVAALRHSNDQRRYRAAHALGSIGSPAEGALQTALRSPHAQVRAGAAKAFCWFDEPDSKSVSALMAALTDKDEHVRDAVIEAIATLGSSAEGSLRSAAGGGPHARRVAALRALAAAGWTEEATLELLTDGAEAEQPAIRAASIAAAASCQSDVCRPRALQLVISGLRDSSAAPRNSAIEVIQRLGPVAAPAVNELANLLGHSDDKTKVAAAEALGRIGPPATPALPHLLEVLAQDLEPDGRVLPAVIRAIGRTGPDATGRLLQSGGGQIPPERLVLALAAIGPEAVPAIQRALESNDKAVRLLAVRALGQIDYDVRMRVNELMNMLSDDDATVRATATRTLGQIGPRANSAQKELMETLDDPSSSVRAAALVALPAIGASHDKITSALIDAVRDGTPELRRSAVIGLRSVHPSGDQVAQALAGALSDSETGIREQAARGLEQLGNRASGAAEQLVAALADPQAIVRARAAHALAAIRPSADVVAGPLSVRLDDSDESVVQASLSALARIGVPDGQALPLDELANHPSENVRVALCEFMSDLTPEIPRGVGLLQTCLDDSQWAVRRAAALSLGKFGAPAKGAVPKLLSLLASPEDSESARRAIRGIGTAGPEALPQLIAALKSGDRRIRYLAVHILGEIGPAASAALTALRELEPASQRFEERVERAIQKIEIQTAETPADQDAQP